MLYMEINFSEKELNDIMEELQQAKNRIAGLERQVQSQQQDINKAIGAFEHMGLKWNEIKLPVSQQQF